jgi:hypothetical protein
MTYISSLEKLSATLSGSYNTIFEHGSSVGDTREKALIEFLKKVMPGVYGFSPGEVFDEHDARSRQLDLIIYDTNYSVIFSDGTGKILAPVESTYGFISVKSTLSTGGFAKAVNEINSYEGLHRQIPPQNVLNLTPLNQIELQGGFTFNARQNQNINCIFAYDNNVAVKTLLEMVKGAGNVDLLVVPGKVCIVGRQRAANSVNEPHYYCVEGEHTLAFFIILLQIYLRQSTLVARDTRDLIRSLAEISKISR